MRSFPGRPFATPSSDSRQPSASASWLATSLPYSEFMKLTLSALLFCAVLCAQTPASLEKSFDSDLKSAEGEIVSLAEAMPADKYNFAPTAGAFDGVRTFALQMRHIAAVNYEVAAALLARKFQRTWAKTKTAPIHLPTKKPS